MKNTLHFTFLRTLMILAFGLFFNGAWGQTYYQMSTGNYSQNFADISSWTPNFASDNGAVNWSSVAINNSGTIPDGKKTSKSSATFSTSTSGGIQKGSENLLFLSTGSGNNSEAVAVDLLLNFTGTTAGTLSFDWAAVDNSNGSRPSSLRVYYSVDNTNFIEIPGALILEKTSPASGAIVNVALPEAFSGASTARLRFYNHNSSATGSGNRDKISIDNIYITATPSTILLEPSNNVTNFVATTNSHNKISLSWNDAVGTNPASGYLVLANTTGVFTDPVDGVEVSEDNNLSDGAAAVKIIEGAQQVAFTSLLSETSYFFKIYSFSNFGSNINYKINLVPTSFTTTNVLPTTCFEEGFEGLQGGSSTTSNSSELFTGNSKFPNSSNAYQAGNAIKLGSGSSSGYLESTPLQGLGSSLIVQIEVKGWTSVEGNLQISLGGQTKTVVYSATVSNSFEVVEIDFEQVAPGSLLKVETSAKRAFIGDIKVLCQQNSTTWNGTAWSSGIPSATLDAIIAGNYSTGAAAPQGAFTAKSLTVNSGIFTIASGTSVTVENAVTNSAGVDNFIVENNANLVQTTSVANTGAITVLRNSAPIVRLDHTLWSSPVATQNLYAFSPNTLTNRFYVYDTTTDSYVTTGLSASSTFISGKGFGVRAPNNFQTSPALAWTGTFKGEPNNGDVTFALSTAGTGFNLVGNPYPSTINANLFVNSTNNPAINGTLYFYAHSLAMNAEGNFPAGTNYTTWNSTGHTLATASTVVPNGTIQVGQGFIVKATQAGNVNFTNAMRTADTNNQFFRTANTFTANTEIEKHRIWLDLTNAEGTAFNQILIGYVAGATEGVDRNFDGLSFGNTGSSLSTKIEGAEYAIQARSLPFQSSDVVPVTFKAVTSGNYSINLSNMDGLFAESQDVFLKDNTSGTIHNLKSSAYTFSTTEGTFQNRFEVVYNSALGVPETIFNSNSIVAFKKNNVLNVEAKNTNIASITAYDVQGRLVYTKSNINANAIELSDLKVQNGVLLLQVTSVEGITATIKVIY